MNLVCKYERCSNTFEKRGTKKYCSDKCGKKQYNLEQRLKRDKPDDKWLVRGTIHYNKVSYM